MTSAPARRGRRPGGADTRALILTAARGCFASLGYAGTTIRRVAAEAGVDAALVHHYFGTKDDLFLAALDLPVDPRTVVGPALSSGLDGAGERLLRAFLEVWEDAENRPALLALVRGSFEPDGQRLLRDGFLTRILEPAEAALGLTDGHHRMSLVLSQLAGLVLARYVLALEPLASLEVERVVATYAPTLQRYLDGDLP